MAGFYGKYYYTIDPKGRLIIPAPFREIFNSTYGTKIYITNAAFDSCLHIYPQEEWQKLQDKVRQLPKMDESVRFFMYRVIASAQECELDKQGRILIPSSLREDAKLNSDVAVVGQIDRIDLWDRNEWNNMADPSKVNRKEYEERLSSFGL
ncbi:MAG: division/cell wall cluster transcriptional repressor MraZ [bacterium]